MYVDGGASTSLMVRPWFDTVADLQAQAFAIDTPSQRQQLRLDGNLLQDDGRVLAQHGVVAECTMQLVRMCGKTCWVWSACGASCFEAYDAFIMNRGVLLEFIDVCCARSFRCSLSASLE